MLSWRAEARAVFDVWSELYGASEAIDCARLVPPKCIRGRWGQVTRCMEFVLKPNTRHLVVVLETTFRRKAEKSKKKKRKRPVRDELEAVHFEEAGAYSERMTKWADASVRAITDVRFWLMMRISLTCRGPLDHFAHYIATNRILGVASQLHWHD